MQMSASKERRRPRVDRREAARMLQCSRDNVRRLDRIKQLKTGKQDRNGTYTYDRGEVESLANKRGLRVRPSGELAARVFRMFKERRPFQDIVIETEQEPEVILALRQQFEVGFDYGKQQREESEEARLREHDEEMRAMDRELERRRRGVLIEEPAAGPGLANGRHAPFSEMAGEAARRAR